jgi:hypothetical protein
VNGLVIGFMMASNREAELGIKSSDAIAQQMAGAGTSISLDHTDP